MRKKIPLIVAIVVLGLFATAYLTIPKTYSIYGEAFDMARKDQWVRSTLGNNIRDGLFVYSNISKGMAKIEVPIEGEKGAGMLLIRGRKLHNKWELTSVLIELDSDSRRYSIYQNVKQ